MKNLLSIFLLAAFMIGCGDSGPPSPQAACQKGNNLCKDMEGAQEMDCAAAQAQYDTASDEDKAKTDKVNQCILASSDCMAASICLLSAFEDAFEDFGNNLTGDESAGDENAGDENAETED